MPAVTQPSTALADPNLKTSRRYKPSEIAWAESLGLSVPFSIQIAPKQGVITPSEI